MSGYPTHEEISRRAHELWLARGKPDGFAAEDWAQAERELLRQHGIIYPPAPKQEEKEAPVKAPALPRPKPASPA